MKLHVRLTLVAMVVCALAVLEAPAAAQAVGVEAFFAANCNATHEACGKKAVEENKEPSESEARTEGFTQAAGHPPFGVTDFKLETHEEFGIKVPNGFLTDNVTELRTDVAPGVATNPETVPKCSMAEFTSTLVEPEKGLYLAPTCSAETIIGENTAEAVIPIENVKKEVIGFEDKELKGKVYNLEQPTGLSSDFGVALELAPGIYAHTFIEGNVEWASDYHDYFKIKNIAPGLIRSRLVFKGNKAGTTGFLTNPTSCTGPGPQTTTTITTITEKGVRAEKKYKTPIGTENCAAVPFEPGLLVTPETSQSDANDGLTATVSIPHNPDPEGLDDSQLKTAVVTLPEGMTINPSAAAGLEACTPAQARIHSTTPGTACPSGSKIGEVTLNVPGLPKGSLAGNIYLGGPESGPITGPPYSFYLDAESTRYGVSVRIRGEAIPNETTGQVTTVFPENPEQPFSEAILHFNGGALAPIANPLLCGNVSAVASFSPYSATAEKVLGSPFTVDANGKGGACSTPLAFSPAQSTSNQTATAGAKTSFSFTLERPEGQQYLKAISTTLPEGLLALLPTAEECAEAQANAGTCPAGSAIGTVTAFAGSGPTPYAFPGTVYLTGPYKGAPFGMSVVVPEVAGPFNLGNSITRATINVNEQNARVTVASEPPLIVHGGVPVRLRKLVVNVNRQGFMVNPTNCSALHTESSLTGVQGTTATASSPFQVEKCASLAFKPSFKAASLAKTSKAAGASLETTLNLPSGGSNVKSVLVTLPAALPSRGTTLKKACLAATFDANPYACPAGSFVGGVRANTPTLKSKLKGPAILVSHANAAFPDLDLLLEAEGVRVILKGTTNIKNSITTTNFETTPDAPVSSITVNLPLGAHSALAAFGNLCAKTLYMPTVITGQNGTVFKQKTKIAVKECGVQIVKKRVIGNAVYVTVKTFVPGRVSGTGGGLSSVFRRLRGATTTTFKVPLNGRARRRGRPFKVRLRIGFLPNNRKLRASASFATLTFR